ncbi:OmpA family protein [Paraburkholderia sp. FT54]|uniref:OmpA family protein n=1 Tax=Paraburkholderia sp. FT54 TaxID=3074437 RepID=UPI0028773989|nr:OmpA family protein [Paraburkholderia sp. FT54]WNC90315.1 OmpA family protein [Paraburkholderia sp. FT54]
MNTTLFKYLRAPLLGAFVTFLAACTTQSGPTYTLHAVSVPNEAAPTYRVSCLGLFESSNSCVRVAEETCQAEPVRWLEAIDGVNNAAPVKDSREMTFMCGKPVVPVSQPAPEPVQPQPQAKQVVPQVRLLLQGNANFATDSAALSPTAKENLDHFIAVNRGVNLHRVTVTGYTDKTGSEAHNLKLSQARAAAVVQHLRDGGLHADQFVAQGLGSADPVASNATAEGRMQNRRVDVHVFAE